MMSLSKIVSQFFAFAMSSVVEFGSRTTSRRDFKPKGLQAEIKTLQAPQNTILSSVKRFFSKILASLVHNKRNS